MLQTASLIALAIPILYSIQLNATKRKNFDMHNVLPTFRLALQNSLQAHSEQLSLPLPLSNCLFLIHFLLLLLPLRHSAKPEPHTHTDTLPLAFAQPANIQRLFY